MIDCIMSDVHGIVCEGSIRTDIVETFMVQNWKSVHVIKWFVSLLCVWWIRETCVRIFCCFKLIDTYNSGHLPTFFLCKYNTVNHVGSWMRILKLEVRSQFHQVNHFSNWKIVYCANFVKWKFQNITYCNIAWKPIFNLLKLKEETDMISNLFIFLLGRNEWANRANEENEIRKKSFFYAKEQRNFSLLHQW
jgi:hypothetical protein